MHPEMPGDFPQPMEKLPTRTRVLVVEDDPLMRWALTETLRERGYEVSEGADAGEAETALRGVATPFDVVFLDYRLPDASGLSLLPLIRERSPGSKVVVMTAFGNAQVVQEALCLGACTVISKPFDMTAVPELIARASAGAFRPARADADFEVHLKRRSSRLSAISVQPPGATDSEG